jgi:hypothetical protein
MICSSASTVTDRSLAWLGNGCDDMRAGLNVVVDGTIDTPQLQIVDPLQGVQDQVCLVTRT